MKKLLLLICSFLTFSSFVVKASHMMGGEITWTCHATGTYVFQLKFYRDCNGIPGPNAVNLVTNASIGTIPLTLVSQVDISPVGSGCPTCANPQNYPTAVEEFVYRSSLVVLSGTPPASGWYFYYDDCCRNSAIINLDATGGGMQILRAVMYAGSNFTPGICNDNSPQFAERPSIGLCNSDTVNYANSALDPDLDSLVYDWGKPLDGSSWPFTNYPFAAGFSFSSPLPSSSLNPANVNATLDPATGIINFYSVTTGAFVTVTKVSSYKCGQLVAEVFREVEIVLLNCPINTGPISTNHSPQFGTGNQTEVFTLLAGDSISLPLSISDFEFLNTPTPSMQVVALQSNSIAFGTNDTSSTSGCLIPPCATMNHPSPYSTSFPSLSEELNWVTACAHAGFNNGCLQHQRTFHFVFRANDNFCPANGVRYKNVIVNVTGPLIYQIGNDLAVSYPGVTLQWYLNGVPIQGATDTIITPTQSGVYTVMCSTGSGCQMLSNAVNRSFAGIENPTIEPTLSVYPNPLNSGQQLQVLVSNFTAGQQVININDISGRTVKTFTIELHNTTEHLAFDITELKAGIYQFSISNSSGLHQNSFVVK